jgi:hypothetical protein
MTACGVAADRSGTLVGVDTTAPASTAPGATAPNTSAPTTSTLAPESTSTGAPTAPPTTVPITAWNAFGSAALDAPGSAADCPSRRSAVVYRREQRGVLCKDGEIILVFAVTTHRRVPDAGVYPVLSKNLYVTSDIGGHISKMRHFTAFTPVSPRIAFHSVPKDLDGNYVQTLDSVGTPEVFGQSAGCIRVLPDVAEYIYGFLRRGDRVRIVG